MRTALLVAGLATSVACGEETPPTPAPEPPSVERAAASYLGVQVCASCHAEEARLWRGSHHDLAMQEASGDTVLGDFDDAVLEHRGQRFSFQRRNGRFFVRTAGADGELRDFEVEFSFGVEPLQQYLVRLPGGRLQAVAAAWDTRPVSAGGQRWFHLHPEDSVPPGDVLHWTGLAGRWNTMCADCHSTNVSKGYRPSDDTYETTWSEIDVSCEACHGAGSEHVAWAEKGADANLVGLGLDVDLRSDGEWRFEPKSPIAHRVPPTASETQIETCAPCHARRSPIAPHDSGGRFLDSYRPALLDEGLYHADGQILDEVFVWGSFLQSRMHAAGVACSDCHDPHRLRIDEPDAVCSSCHRSEVFATPSHHHHAADSAGASCVACHMPARTYMVVDPRHDHSFRVPRPDLTATIGIPNACSKCHLDQVASWAADATARWYGSGRSATTQYGEVLDAGRRRTNGAARALAALSRDAAKPAIVRATALWLLAPQLEAGSVRSVRAGLRDSHALVRMAAVSAAEMLPPEEQRLALEPLLTDPRRAVRIEAGRALAPLRQQLSEPRSRIALDQSLDEYRAAQSINADRPESHVSLGILQIQLGEMDAAQRAYETAIRLGPFFVPAYVNLADLLRMRGADAEGERILREGLARVPDSASLHHGLGLLLVRRQRLDDALDALGRAAELQPGNARYAYVHGVALHSTGRKQRALAALEEGHRAHPADTDLLVALVTIYRDEGDVPTALRYARQLVELRPEDPATHTLVRELEAMRP